MRVDGRYMWVDGACMRVDGRYMWVDGACLRVDGRYLWVDGACMRCSTVLTEGTHDWSLEPLM